VLGRRRGRARARRGGEVGGEDRQLAIGARGLHLFDAFAELLERQPSLDHHIPEHADAALALGVAGQDRGRLRSVVHPRQGGRLTLSQPQTRLGGTLDGGKG
jgi:hypothetical protein